MVLSTSDPKECVEIRLGNSGIAADEPKTVMSVFQANCKKFADAPALHQKVMHLSDKPAAETPWTTWTFKQYEEQVFSFAKSLISLGFEKHDCINIIGFNSPEWFFANFGTIAAGGIAAGIYTTNLPEACHYVSDHSKAKVVVVEGVKQLEKYTEISARLPNLKAVVVYGEKTKPMESVGNGAVPVYLFDEFLQLGKDAADVSDATVQAAIDVQRPGETCTLIYTSGTTGNPKAVMITHDNLTWTSKNMLVNTLPRALTNDDNIISYLPLSHIAAQMLDMHCPIQCGCQVWFAQADALRGSLGTTLKEVRPTIFFGVPRVWEKMYEAMQKVAKSTTGVKKMISTWAKGKASAKNYAAQYGESGSAPWGYGIASKILSKVHVALGLERCLCAFTGAAPIEVKILNYFASIDLPIYELFGQSECTGPHTVNFPGAWKVGTCGRPLPGTESRMEPGTGELSYTGRHIFAGYMYMDDKTVETIDSGGWLHSGDVVSFDDCSTPGIEGPSGFMSITGRIKELIITAGGENVAPVLIEAEFKLAMPALSNCMVIGDKRKFLSILLCLLVEVDEEGVASDKLTGEALDTSKKIGSSAITTAEVMTCSKWKDYFDKGMAVANDKTISRAQRVAKWAVVPTDFTEKGGELTPTLKLKRSVAEAKYSEIVEGIYA
mmetsp:Transcript_26973/g.41814  ORF Transcript_26973/g.41814 Transcript_26973/m.41814 type:complete len:665 (+) Transcript_26973:133-2127(+)|eukprot:CAMPEP_0196816604 /NCGR_PEP_ID=MMETSP1362-20130617/56294_1 /TAXON_ID=163516 /ORGANISM="Leptocylindrus danicus, Strain CCMP1856" /LENGTH=664 /DNA_ID=CAMNT_0042194011 /DNA_START=114 /DNA_END=2108 /DNA_ORIENTATION=-